MGKGAVMRARAEAAYVSASHVQRVEVLQAQAAVRACARLREPVDALTAMRARRFDRYWYRAISDKSSQARIGGMYEELGAAYMAGVSLDGLMLGGDLILYHIYGAVLPAPFNVSRYMRNQWAVVKSHGFAAGAAIGLALIHFTPIG